MAGARTEEALPFGKSATKVKNVGYFKTAHSAKKIFCLKAVWAILLRAVRLGTRVANFATKNLVPAMSIAKYLVSRFALGGFAALSLWWAACRNEATCKYKPEPIFDKNLPHIVQYNFEKEGSQSLESLLLDRGVLLEISQEVCPSTRQEYRFKVQGDFAALPDSFWMKEATRQLVFLSSFSPKQAALKDWADIIEQRRTEMRLGEDREVQPGIFVRVDRVLSPQEGTLVLVFSQK